MLSEPQGFYAFKCLLLTLVLGGYTVWVWTLPMFQRYIIIIIIIVIIIIIIIIQLAP
jgi:hypothetical protein